MLEISPNDALVGEVHVGNAYTHSVDITNPLGCGVDFEIKPVRALYEINLI